MGKAPSELLYPDRAPQENNISKERISTTNPMKKLALCSRKMNERREMLISNPIIAAPKYMFSDMING